MRAEQSWTPTALKWEDIKEKGIYMCVCVCDLSSDTGTNSLDRLRLLNGRQLRAQKLPRWHAATHPGEQNIFLRTVIETMVIHGPVGPHEGLDGASARHQGYLYAEACLQNSLAENQRSAVLCQPGNVTS